MKKPARFPGAWRTRGRVDHSGTIQVKIEIFIELTAGSG
ncbi:hypothetical protein L917_21537 [Phytophthora nicotianae]|uniref:Uncharacterized protein n=1 Tax=Phytophthora nicotianae TaxID=4792 RepID=W2JZA5_PHYNI|nr:hypothetical protein L917_21537 [Phytophthora nicotianae]